MTSASPNSKFGQSPISASPGKGRREHDVMKLLMSEHQVMMSKDDLTEFHVKFRGPKDSPYEGGLWKVRVELPASYPYKSPSIGFTNRIFHPNVDETSGSVCLDVINQTWSPMYDLFNVFELFLPQLLLYPNPSDPLNGDAAALMLKEPELFKMKVKDYVSKYAKEEMLKEEDEEKEESEVSDMSDLSQDEDATDFFNPR